MLAREEVDVTPHVGDAMKETPARVYGDTLVYHKQGATIQVQVGMADWYRWLETVSSFAFQGEQGSFTASKEHSGSKRSGRYWKAHRKRNGKRAVVYLGKSERLTLERLKAAAGKMPSGYRFRLTLFLGSGRNFRLILNLTRLWPFCRGSHHPTST